MEEAKISANYKDSNKPKAKSRADGEGSIFSNKKNGVVAKKKPYKAQFRKGKKPNGKPDMITKTFKTKKEAAEWLSSMAQQYKNISSIAATVLTVNDVYKSWFADKDKVEGLKAGSLDRIESMMQTNILPAIGDDRICDITYEDIEQNMSFLWRMKLSS